MKEQNLSEELTIISCWNEIEYTVSAMSIFDIDI